MRFHFFISVLLVSFLSLFSVNVLADQESSSTTTTTSEAPNGDTVVKQVTTKTTKIVTPVPTAKEVIAAPKGYVSCFTVAEGWVNDTWIPAHQVCQYDNTAMGSVWVEGYWGCNKATTEGVCTNWEWKTGHWEKKLVVY